MTKVENQMAVSAFLRNFLSGLTHPCGQKRFQILDGGDVSSHLLLHYTRCGSSHVPFLFRLAACRLFLRDLILTLGFITTIKISSMLLAKVIGM